MKEGEASNQFIAWYQRQAGIMSHKIGEYDFSDANRDKERERRFRWQALERLPGDEVRLERLREQPQEAARLLRVALEDVATHQVCCGWRCAL